MLRVSSLSYPLGRRTRDGELAGLTAGDSIDRNPNPNPNPINETRKRHNRYVVRAKDQPGYRMLEPVYQLSVATVIL